MVGYATLAGDKHLFKIRGANNVKVEIGGTVDTVLFHVVCDLTVDCFLGTPRY